MYIYISAYRRQIRLPISSPHSGGSPASLATDTKATFSESLVPFHILGLEPLPLFAITAALLQHAYRLGWQLKVSGVY